MYTVSRRTFVELATGMLTSLPVLAGGLVLAPRPAYAEDDYTLPDQLDGKKSEYTVIDVVAPWEVGFMVVDITKGEELDGGLIRYPPVAGAHITVTSRFNGKVVKGDTNENGVTNLDIRELAVHEEGQDVNNLDDYFFNGSIVVTRDDYREFKTGLVEVQGGEGLQVPTHPLDSDGPYPYQASFDDWDALYTRNVFTMTPKNDEKHTIGATIYGLPEASAATFELWVKGEKAARKSVQSTVGEKVQVGTRIEKVYVRTEMRWEIVDFEFGTGKPIYGYMPHYVYEDRSTPIYGRPATASFEGLFLQEGHKDQIPEGAQLQVVVKQKGHDPWTLSLGAAVEKGVGDEPESDTSGKELSLINASNGKMGPGGLMSTGQKWPDIIPILGGGSLNFWWPTYPLNIFASPTGFIEIVVDIPLLGYRNDKGADEPSSWRRFPLQSVQKQFDKKWDTMKKMVDKTSSTFTKPGKVKQIDLFKSVSVDVNFQVIALAKWDKKKSLFQGEAAAQFVLGFDFTLSENFMAGPVPILITFALDMTATIALQAATYVLMEKDEMNIKAATDFSRWQFDYENTGFTMTLNVTPSLSVGVGVRGVASVSVKGAITFTLFFCVPMGTQPDNLPSPHFAAGWSANISIVIELFLFTSTFPLFDKPFENFYDNWDGKNVTAQAEDAAAYPLAALADKSFEELLADLEPITDAMLAQTSEASLGAQGISAQAEGEPAHIDWAAIAETGATQTLPDGSTVAFRQEVVQLDDGSSMTLDVYELRGPAPAGEEEAQPGEAEQGQEQPSEDEQDPAAATVAAMEGEDGQAAAADTPSEPEAADPQGQDPVPTGQPGQELAASAVAVAEGADGLAASTASSGAGQTAPPEDLVAATDSGAEGSQAAAADTSTEPETADTQAQDDPAAIQAQEDPDPEAQGQAQPDVAVTWLQAQAGDSLPSPGVASLGAQAGIRPSSDLLLFGSADQHVLSAAHAKVLDIGAPVGKTHEYGVWCFRIASVEVGGHPRTRVVANCIEGAPRGASKVIELDTKLKGMPHDELYDYDFDVMVRKEAMPRSQTESVVSLVILSGKRDGGGGTTLATASTELAISHVRIASADFVRSSGVLRGGDAGCFSMRASDVANRETAKPHSISNLKITDCPKDDTSYDLSVVLFLDRFADTAEGTLGDKATVCVGALMVRRMHALGDTFSFTVEKYPASWWHGGVGDIDPTVYEADVTPTSFVGDPLYGVPYFLMLRGAERAHYVRSVLSDYEPDGVYRLNIPQKCGDLDPSVRLVWCAALGGFLASYPDDPTQLDLAPDKRDYSKWSLHKITWTNDKSPQMRAEPIGPAGFNVVNFAVNPRGTFIFWPHTRDADEDRVWDAKGQEDVQERPAVYQIMACRVRGGRFSDPFVVADLPTDTDMLSALGVNGAAVMEALRTVYVDTGERTPQGKPLYHAADIYYTAVPAVRCVTATACEAPRPFVTPGGKISFYVAVRNDGNTYLKGCTLQLCMHNKDTDKYDAIEGASASITFDKDTIRESLYNPSDGKGGLQNLEDDYALAPGKTSVYNVTVTIPAHTPSGDMKVLFVAKDGVLVDDLYKQDEEGGLEASAMEFHVEPGDYKVVQVRTQHDQDPNQRHMDLINVSQAQAGGTYYQAEFTGGGSDSHPDTPSGSDQGTLPKTGDEGVGAGLGLAGAGLAALGAAVATYERRRAENEGR